MVVVLQSHAISTLLGRSRPATYYGVRLGRSRSTSGPNLAHARSTVDASPRPYGRSRPRHWPLATGHRPGFTLLELIVVLAVIGILATLALPKLQNVPRRARESTLKNNLHTIRTVLDQHKADKGTYPESLDALEEEGYLRSVPVDPITKKRDTWELIYEERASDDPPAEVDEDEPPGIIDVKSGAEGTTMNGVPYGEL